MPDSYAENFPILFDGKSHNHTTGLAETITNIDRRKLFDDF
ncbi:MAG: hypothetical protein OXL41_14305 [Nitrospinae bacterium]|nr:hypothetical protein [Nitrospinota bacterium]